MCARDNYKWIIHAVFAFFVICRFSWTSDLNEYQLIIPHHYIAFSGPLEIEFRIPVGIHLTHPFVKVSAITENGVHVLDTLPVPAGESTGKLEVKCGLIEHAGTFTLKMYGYSEGPLLTQANIDVRWPEINVSLPMDYEALTQPVGMEVKSAAICSPVLRSYSFIAELLYLDQSLDKMVTVLKLIHTEPYTNITSQRYYKELPCQLFDRTGLYYVVLKSTFSDTSIVSRSNSMYVRWGKYYSLSVLSRNSSTIFPCYGAIRVVYSQTSCLKKGDKIRLYSLEKNAKGSFAVPRRRIYQEERSANTSQNTLDYSCSLFSKAAMGYCFVYASVSKSGSITEQYEKCLSTWPGAVLPIDGNWNQWSQWGQCTVSCGIGERSRVRLCNKPETTHGGRFCVGEPVEWKPCNHNCTDSVPFTPLYTLPSSYNNSACKCGCSLRNMTGQIIASGRCSGLSEWLITTHESYKLSLHFDFFELMATKQWIKIRDGTHSSSILLAVSDGKSVLTTVTSLSHQVLIEFMTETEPGFFPDIPTEPVHVYGFIVKFISIGTNSSAAPVMAMVTVEINGISVMHTVKTVGIMLCVIIVITTVLFVVHNNQQRHRKFDYAVAAQEESPKQKISKSTIKCDSEGHWNPLEETIFEHDANTPLVVKSEKRESGKKKTSSNGRTSRASSVSSQCSAKVKTFRQKSQAALHGSPKLLSSDYSSLSSPRPNISLEDDIHDVSSPKLDPAVNKNAVPRSQKIHPFFQSLHDKKPSTTSPSSSKTELLLVKRKEAADKEEERVITGSSGTSPSVNEPAFPGVDRAEYNEVTPTQDTIQLNNVCTDDEANENPTDIQTTSFIMAPFKARRPTSLTESYSSTTPLLYTDTSSPDSPAKTPITRTPITTTTHQSPVGRKPPVPNIDERHTLLPKPDGQSPETSAEDSIRLSAEPLSKPSTPGSIRSTLSKSLSTKSLATPSEAEGLEYDDFIEDDPLSYFEVDELHRMKWSGVERIGTYTADDD